MQKSTTHYTLLISKEREHMLNVAMQAAADNERFFPSLDKMGLLDEFKSFVTEFARIGHDMGFCDDPNCKDTHKKTTEPRTAASGKFTYEEVLKEVTGMVETFLMTNPSEEVDGITIAALISGYSFAMQHMGVSYDTMLRANEDVLKNLEKEGVIEQIK